MGAYAGPQLHGKPVMTVITPEQAQMILKRTTRPQGSRTPDEELIKAFSLLIDRGMFVSHIRAAAVQIDRSLQLLNGNHRMIALSRATKPIRLPLVTEIPLFELLRP